MIFHNIPVFYQIKTFKESYPPQKSLNGSVCDFNNISKLGCTDVVSLKEEFSSSSFSIVTTENLLNLQFAKAKNCNYSNAHLHWNKCKNNYNAMYSQKDLTCAEYAC